MSGLGVGTAVGLGTVIALGLVAPSSAVIEYVATGAFYGVFIGVMFELYRFAFTWRRPFGR